MYFLKRKEHNLEHSFKGLYESIQILFLSRITEVWTKFGTQGHICTLKGIIGLLKKGILWYNQRGINVNLYAGCLKQISIFSKNEGEKCTGRLQKDGPNIWIL